jgi:hypothetical protein
MTLSLADISQSVGLTEPNVETLLVQMIDNGEINAVIDEEAGMVQFCDDIEDNSYKFT